MRRLAFEILGTEEAMTFCNCSKYQISYSRKAIAVDMVKHLISQIGNSSQVAEGITSEEMKADYLSQFLPLPPSVYRMDNNGKRYYYTKEDGVTFYDSVTSMLKNQLPLSPQLQKWQIDNFSSSDELFSFMNEKAHYGTMLHMLAGKMVIRGQYDLTEIRTDMMEYATAHHLSKSFYSYETELKKDLMAWGLFCINHDVKPLAVEIILASKELRLAGALDFVFEMNISDTYKAGAKQGLCKGHERGIAIVDIKSSRKGFFDSHAHQLQVYKRMWEEQYPDIHIDKIYNWGPSGWAKTPKYHLKDQSENSVLALTETYIALNRLTKEPGNQTALSLSGVINIEKGTYGTINVTSLNDCV